MASRTFVNDPADAVCEAIDGYLLTRRDLTRLDAYPGTRVVLRKHRRGDIVSIISGGGAGHEPAHAGFVGSGMLTGAVCGDIFASPHVSAILSSILSCASPRGVLLIVKNYTGDRLAFRLAAERATAATGVPIATVYVAEDAALDAGRITGRRGLAGTVLVHKIAGAIAETGADLATVAAAARAVAANCHTAGVALSMCDIPGRAVHAQRFATNVVEVGMGIHGEPGVSTSTSLPTATQVMSTLWDLCLARRSTALPSPAPVALLLNNLGGVSNLEMSILLHALAGVARATLHVVTPVAVMTGPVMTALDMRGVSLTLLDLTCEPFPTPTGPMTLLQALHAPTACTAFPGVTDGAALLKPLQLEAPPTAPVARTKSSASVAPAWMAPLTAALRALEAAEAELNAADAAVGDGDCGSTMAAVARAVQVAASRVDAASPSVACLRAFCADAGEEVGAIAGGTSGVLYALMLAAAGNALAGREGLPPLAAVAQAAATAVHVACDASGASEGCRTMMDALAPAVRAMQGVADAGGSVADAVAAAADAAAAGVAATQHMRAIAGRSTYIDHAVLEGKPDPGAKAAHIWLATLSAAMPAGSGGACTA